MFSLRQWEQRDWKGDVHTLALTAVKNCDRGRVPDGARIGEKTAMANIRLWDAFFNIVFRVW